MGTIYVGVFAVLNCIFIEIEFKLCDKNVKDNCKNKEKEEKEKKEEKEEIKEKEEKKENEENNKPYK